MATPIIMPRQGQSVESCIIAKWHKKKGDHVAIGDILFSYETDKASFDEEAKASGVILDIFFEEGDDVPCLLNVCVIGNEGESAQEFNPNNTDKKPVLVGLSATPTTANLTPAVNSSAEITNILSNIAASSITASVATEKEHIQNQCNPTQTNNNISGNVKISPRAGNLAKKLGIDPIFATASGPYGRIIEKDIVATQESGLMFTASAISDQFQGVATAVTSGTGLGGRITTTDLKDALAGSTDAVTGSVAETISSGALPGISTSASGGIVGRPDTASMTDFATPLYEEVKLPNIRKVIAKMMHQSLSTMAQLTLNSSFDATDILEFRKKLKESKERLGLENITINNIIIYAVSRTLANHRSLNAHFLDDKMLYFKNVNMGVAVDTDRGLMVPTLFDANLKSLNEISAGAKILVRDCQAGTINPDLLKNGSFTVTNLGTLDIESFTPVINPPQTAILGVNNIVQRVREVNGQIEFYPAMGLSLTFDHRAVDGAPAAKFLKELKTNLENFSMMLVK